MNLPFTNGFNRKWHFSEDKLCSRICVSKPQFLSTMGLGNEMKFKLRLLPFSLVHILCLCTFCFQFRNLQPLSKCWYMLTVWLGKVACSKSFFCRLTGKYHWSVWQGTRFLVSLIWRSILLPGTVSLGFSFKLLFFEKVYEFYSQTGCYRLLGAGIRLEGEKMSPHSLKITPACMFILSLSRFRPSLTGLAMCGEEECGATADWDDTKDCQLCSDMVFGDTLQVELVLSDTAATVSHNLFNWCSVILRRVTQQCG